MRRELERDNRGIALISVMVGVMLCLLLSATIMRVSYLSFLQKSIGEKTTTTFYENEMFVDDLKLGIQKVVAQAAVGVSTTSSDATQDFIVALKTGLGAGSVATLNARLQSFLKEDDTIYDVKVTVEGEVIGGIKKYVVEENNDLVIKNVLITYKTKPSGYLSKVNTDIRIRSPYYTTTTTSTSGGYSMFAGSGFEYLAVAAKPAMQTIEGDIYVGYDPITEVKSGTDVVSATAMTWDHWVTIYWPEDTSVTINGDVRISGGSNLVILSKNVDIRGTIYVSNDSNLIISKDAVVKCQGIVVEATITESQGGTYTYWHDNWYNVDTRTEPESKPNENGRWVRRTGTEIIKTWNGKTINASYSSGTNTKYNYLPTCGESLNSSTCYNNTGTKSGLYAWNGSQAERIDKGSKLGSKLPGLTIDANNKVHPRVSKTIDGKNYTFDEEYVKLIDVDYFFKFVKNSNNVFNPGGSLPTNKFSKSGTKYIPNNNVSTSDLTSEVSDYRHQTYTYGNGKSHGIEVQLGNLQTINRSEWQFAIGGDCVTLPNDMNTGAVLTGVIITPDRITATCREGSSTITALGDVAESKSYARTFFDNIGRQAMKGANVPLEYQLINNFFVGGIKVFYEDNAGGGGGGSTSTVNVVRNGSLDAVTLENWSKSYVEENPS